MQSASGIFEAVILKNATTGKIICKDLKIAESFIDRSFGLLIKTNPRNLLFKTRFGIHTFFLKEPIDVIILDSQMRVIKIKENLQPNRLFFWNPKFNITIELRNQTLNQSRIKILDKLIVSTNP